GAVSDDELRPRAARAAELTLEKDVEPLAGELGRNAKDAQHGALGHPFGAREAIEVRVRDPKPAHRSSLTTRRLQNRVMSCLAWRSCSSRPSSLPTSKSAVSPT